MTKAEFKKGLEVFTKPLSPSEIVWKIQASKTHTTVVPYIDNRAVMQRLDDSFGAENWRNDFQRWGSDKGVKCGISLCIGNEWVTKFDGADETQIEPTKGGFSDSMKRAATQWGLGRDLYDYPRVMFKGVHKRLEEKHLNKLCNIAKAIFKGDNKQDFIFIDLEKGTPQKAAPVKPSDKEELIPNTDKWTKAIEFLKSEKGNMAAIERAYSLSEANKTKLLNDSI